MSDDEAPRRRRPTLHDVARLSGVSRATVSYVLNNVPGQTIPAVTRDRVHAAAEALDYVPLAAAAALRRGHSRIVLVVTEPALSGFVTEPFLTAIDARLTREGLVPIAHRYSTKEALQALAAEIRPYGVIALTSVDPETIAAIEESGVPRIYSSSRGDPAYPRPWEEEIGALQARHLIERGARTLVYASPPTEHPRTVMANSRERGTAAAAAAAGIPLLTRIALGPDLDETVESLRACRPDSAPLGICAFDDEVAAVALAATRRLGAAVPHDIKIIGVDDAPFSPYLSPPLTTLAIDGHRTGWALAERFLNGPAPDDPDEVSHAIATLVLRETT